MAEKKSDKKLEKNSEKNSKNSTVISKDLLNRIARRAVYYSTQMIHLANERDDVQKGDPKVGGHPAACASSTHIMAALHLVVREPQDYFAVKPHASPMDHSYSHLLELFYHFRDERRFTEEEAKKIMRRLRAFMDPADESAEPAFQSYHAVWDADNHNYFPSGTVGIPPVVSGYTALAYRFAKKHEFKIPENAHFWSIIGDSEFREGSLAECMPDLAERELGSVTWIVDYNRQNLDGTRIKNEEDTHGSDAERIENLAKANGWNVFQARHGKLRESFFEKTGGQDLKTAIEKMSDFELQALLVKRDGKVIRTRLIELVPSLRNKLLRFTDEEMLAFFEDLGGHDIEVLSEIFKQCRKSKMPTLVIAHTIKGWSLECQAMTGNHSMLPEQSEVDELRKAEGISENDLFERFEEGSEEAEFCRKRGEYLRAGIESQRALRNNALTELQEKVAAQGGFPKTFGINLKLSPWANTQWMWGQLAAKLIRIANDSKSNSLSGDEALWALAAKHVVTMAPDVGTSTNLNPSMDGKVFAPESPDFEAKYGVKDKRRPNLVPLEKEASRHLRFEIEEGNAMSCAGAFGRMTQHVGAPFLPLMTVYDFFIKRALDQYFYNLYWQSGFILVGTPSGVTLSPEGAQHSWKSDLQIPNGITWEPSFAIEMDWILADAVKRHFTRTNINREGVLIRAVTRGLEQKLMLENLRKQTRHQGKSDDEILEETRLQVLEGGYWVVNYEGFEGYAPGDNVVHIFAMGALAPEAIHASEKLLEQGIFANVCLVTSPELLVGILGAKSNYQHLTHGLGINANLYLRPSQSVPVGSLKVNGQIEVSSRADLLSLRGARIPLVAVCDGEAGLLDNLGSIVGVPCETLAVRKHSKSGRPVDVYRYHHLDPDSIADAAIAQLEKASTEEIIVPRTVIEEVQNTTETTAANPHNGDSENDSSSLH